MNTQRLIIFLIFSFSNATFLAGPNPVTEIAKSAIEIPKINQILAALSKFKNSISSTSQSKSFLRFVADTQEVSTTDPLLDVMKQLLDRVVDFNGSNPVFDQSGILKSYYDIENNMNMLSTEEKIMSIDSLRILVESIDEIIDLKRDLNSQIEKIGVALASIKINYIRLNTPTDDGKKSFQEAVERLVIVLDDTNEYISTSLERLGKKGLYIADVTLGSLHFIQGQKMNQDEQLSNREHWIDLIDGFNRYGNLTLQIIDLSQSRAIALGEFQMVLRAMKSRLDGFAPQIPILAQKLRDTIMEQSDHVNEACIKVLSQV